MKIVIIGAGQVGSHLARSLSQERHDIVLIDLDREKIEEIRDQLDCLSIVGGATSPETLISAGVADADLLIAVTSIDEINIVACALGRALGVKTRIARVRNQEFTQRADIIHPETMGIDLIIHPELEAAREILRLVRYEYAFDLLEFEEGRVRVVGVQIEKNAPLSGHSLKEIDRDLTSFTFRCVAVDRDGTPIVPSGDEVLKAGDRIYVVVLEEDLEKIPELAGIEKKPARNVMILGGGLVGVMVAEDLEKDKRLSVKLVDRDRVRSEEAASKLSRTMVVQGEYDDIDLLAQEGLADMDAYIATSDDDENNVVSSLVARHFQVPRVITVVEKREYVPIIRTIGLDVAVNIRQTTSNTILKYIHSGRVVSAAWTKGIPAEAIEFQITGDSQVVGKELREVKFPRGAIVGARIHRDEVSVATGTTRFFSGDRVVVFTLPGSVDAVEKMFR